MIKILFVGDLSCVPNYGAIATTESLIKILKSQVPESEIKYIGYKSLVAPTPVSGWPDQDDNKSKIIDVIRFIVSFLPKTMISRLKSIWNKRYAKNSFVPYRYDLFEEYFADVSKGIKFQYEKNLIEWADVIYINGEGNIVKGTDYRGYYRTGALYLFFVSWMAKVKFNKYTCIVNHVVDPCNNDAIEIISNVYPKLDRICVRDNMSLRLLEKNGVCNAFFVPDALFSYKPNLDWRLPKVIENIVDFSKPYICIGDSSAIKNNYGSVKWSVIDVFGELVEKLRNIVPQVIFIDGFNKSNKEINSFVKKHNVKVLTYSNCSYHDLYHILKGSELFISGRWHASILSIMANTPIILWGADSHKTQSLYLMLDYPYRFFDVDTLPIHIDHIIETAILIMNDKMIKNNIDKKVSDLKTKVYDNALFLNNITNGEKMG